MRTRLVRYAVLALLLQASSLAAPGPRTRIHQLPDTMIVRRGNFIIAATTDGFVCYGTHQPKAVHCHKAVPKKDKL